MAACVGCGADTAKNICEFCGAQQQKPTAAMTAGAMLDSSKQLLSTPNKPLTYLLWCLGLVGVCGAHRFYTGRYLTGVLWLATGGLCFAGQLFDLVLMPRWFKEPNA
jgi:hypothetical protein